MTTMSAKLSGSLFRTKIPGKSHLDASGFSCGSCFRSFHCLALIIFIFLLSFCLSGCKARHSKMPPAASNGVLPRPDPSYIAWLEQQSMLGMAPDLAAQVSGSGRAYGSRGGAGRVEVLLNAAPNWLWINPLEVGGGNPVFRQIINKNIVSAMKGYGLEGLFLAPLGESGAIWSSRAGAREAGMSHPCHFPRKQAVKMIIQGLYPLRKMQASSQAANCLRQQQVWARISCFRPDAPPGTTASMP